MHNSLGQFNNSGAAIQVYFVLDVVKGDYLLIVHFPGIKPTLACSCVFKQCNLLVILT